MSKLKAGIIGCGGIAAGKHLPSMTATKEADIIAFCDIIKSRAEDCGKKFGAKGYKVYTDYKELLKEDLDFVCVCTPNISHSEISVAALKSGKHVLCEKPMAINYAEGQKMVNAAKETGKLLSIGYQNRYTDDASFLKTEIEKGTLGEIYYAKAHAIRRRGVPTWGVFLDEEKQGGGPLIDIGTHALDLTLYMMNNYKPKFVVGTVYHKLNKDKDTANAWGDWDVKKFTVEDSAFGFIVMENGATIVLESSWALNILDTREAQCTLCGTKAGADFSQGLTVNGVMNGKKYSLKPDTQAGGAAFYDGKSVSPADMEAITFVNAVKGKGKLKVLPEQALVVTQILEGIYTSAKTGKPYYFN